MSKNENRVKNLISLIIDMLSLFSKTNQKEKKTFLIQDSERETNPGFFLDEKI
jgi:hypothetical protein